MLLMLKIHRAHTKMGAKMLLVLKGYSIEYYRFEIVFDTVIQNFNRITKMINVKRRSKLKSNRSVK